MRPGADFHLHEDTAMKRYIAFPLLFVALLGLAPLAHAPAKGTPSKSMKFLVITTHTKEECLATLDEMSDMGKSLLPKTVWGCGAGVHEGWTTIEAKNEDDARAMLPEGMRKNARVVPVGVYTVEQIRSFHQH
jgi:hypothetical protein